MIKRSADECCVLHSMNETEIYMANICADGSSTKDGLLIGSFPINLLKKSLHFIGVLKSLYCSFRNFLLYIEHDYVCIMYTLWMDVGVCEWKMPPKAIVFSW